MTATMASSRFSTAACASSAVVRGARVCGAGRRVRRARRCAASASASELVSGETHAAYMRDAAKTKAPAELPAALRVLQARGYELEPPNARKGMHPLVVPLAKRKSDGHVIGLMIVDEQGGETPVVGVTDGAHLTLLAKNASQYVHWAIVEEEATSDEQSTVVAAAAGSVGVSLHNHGEFKTSGKPFDIYVTTQVGKFPSCMEGLVQRHLDRGDDQSALITCDLYKATFGEWGAPHVFISDLYTRLGRVEEARDAARQALQTPWATVGSRDAIERMVDIAGWSGKSVQEIKDILESRRGPSAAAFDGPKTDKQLAREESETLLDRVARGELESAVVNQRLAECYMNAGKPALAKFIMCGMSA
jgi:hypothetical protein